MGVSRSSKRDFDQLERRRMEAAKLLKRGLPQAEVARRTRVSRESVRRWANQWQRHGVAGLKKAGRAGRKAQLDDAALEQLEQILLAGPEKAGYPNGLWTLDRIAEVIRERFGVEYHAAHIWRILTGKLEWSCQRPVGRARERNQAAIRAWKQTTWPALKKRPKQKAESLFSPTKAD